MRDHNKKFEAFECGEGPTCSWIPAAIAAGGALLGYLGQKEQNKAIEKTNEQNAPQFYGPGMQYAPGVLSAAQQAYNAGQFDPQVNPLQLLGRENQLGYAENLLPSLIGMAHDSWGRALGAETDPYVTQMIQAAQNDLVQDYQRNILPGISDAAQGAGGLGGSRQGVAQGIAGEGLLEGLGDISTRLLSDAYGRKLGHEQAAWGAMNNMLNAGFLPSQTQMGIGELYRQDYGQPARNLAAYNNLVRNWVQGSQGAPAQPIDSPWAGALSGFALGGGFNALQNLRYSQPAPVTTGGGTLVSPGGSGAAPVYDLSMQAPGPFGY